MAKIVLAVMAILWCQGVAADVYYISLLEKDQPLDHYGRFTTDEGVILVTASKVEPSIASVMVKVQEGHDLFFLEPFQPSFIKFPGELARLGGRVFYQAMQGGAESGFHHHEDHEDLHYREEVTRSIKKGRLMAPVPSGSKDVFFEFIPRQRDEGFLLDKLNEFTGEVPVTINKEEVYIKERGSALGRARAREFLKREYKNLGYVVKEGLAYKSGVYRGENFVAERKGLDPDQVVIVGAHLDSVNNPGADDDGAGIVASLAIAKDLAAMDNLPVTVRFVGFDQEEKGLIGSRAYVKSLLKNKEAEKIVGVFIMEMMGYDSDNDGLFHLITCQQDSALKLARLVEDTIRDKALSLEPIHYCTNRSDHAPFWNNGIPAVVMSQNFFKGDANPCYHKACDRADILNFSYMNKLTDAMSGAVQSLLYSL